TATLTIRLRFGGLAGTVLLAGTATDVANNNIFAGEFEVAIRTAGVSGTMVGYGTHTEVPAASGTAVHDITEILPATTVDTTVAQVVNVTATWSAANAANQVRLDFMPVDVWRPGEPHGSHTRSLERAAPTARRRGKGLRRAAAAAHPGGGADPRGDQPDGRRARRGGEAAGGVRAAGACALIKSPTRVRFGQT